MSALALSFFTALIACAALTPLAVLIARRFRLLDRPDGDRKVHVRATPRLGGAALVPACALGWLSLWAWGDEDFTRALALEARPLMALAAGVAAIFAIGLVDDLRTLSARPKLAMEVGVAALLWLAGFRIEEIGAGGADTVHLGMLSGPVTVLWLVGIVNAVNLIDGLDGLASGMSLTACVVLVGLGVLSGDVMLLALAVPVVGALLAFLAFNSNPAQIFLGDSGSLVLGLLLGVASLRTLGGGSVAASMATVPLLLLALPLLDTTLAVVRRLARRKSPFAPDREHLHHRLLAQGYGHREAVWTLYLFAGVFALAALDVVLVPAHLRPLPLLLAGLAAAMLVHRVGLLGARPDRDLRERNRRAATAARRTSAAMGGIGVKRIRQRIHNGRRGRSDELRNNSPTNGLEPVRTLDNRRKHDLKEA